MPRTKVVKKVSDSEANANKEILKRKFDEYVKAKEEEYTQMYNDFCNQLEVQKQLLHAIIPKEDLKKTISQLRSEGKQDLVSTLNTSSLSTESMRHIVQSCSKGKKAVKRSLSCNDDGYRTAESDDEVSKRTSSRRSRTQVKVMKPSTTRRTRSLSKSKLQKSAVKNRFITPTKQNKPTSFGVITPKCAPNTAQTILRRPNMGEIALSLQGSPLMVNSVMADQVANVNIPLVDGRMLSIQPQRGLRLSQIPDLDDDTKQQIKALRDNLDRVCSMMKKY